MAMRLPKQIQLVQSSRHELLLWTRNTGVAATRLRLLQGSMLPQPSIRHWRRKLWKHLGRFQSTGSILLDTTNTTSLESILHKKSKTKDDLMNIQLSLRSNLDKELQRQALQTLLQYGKPQLVRDYLIGQPGGLSEAVLLIQSLALTSDFNTLSQRARELDFDSRIKTLSAAVQGLLALGKKKAALETWVLVSQVDYPNLDIMHKHFSDRLITILHTILTTSQNPSVVVQQSKPLIPEDQHKNLFQVLSYSYYRLNQWHQSIHLWNITPEALRSTAGLVHAIKACSYTQQYSKAMALYSSNDKLHSTRVMKAMIPIVTGLDYKDDALLLVKTLIDKQIIPPYKSIRVLESLLAYNRLDDFDTLVHDYQKNYERLSPMFFNVLMKRELEEKDRKRFVTHLQSIYSMNMKPTTKTFQLVFAQMAKRGNIISALSLLEMLIQRGSKVDIHHFTHILETIENTDSITPLVKVLQLMKRLGIKPNQHFTTALMSLHLKFHNYSEVQRLFYEPSDKPPTQKMYILLMKSYLALNNTDAAAAALQAIKKTSNNLPHVLHSQMAFYCHQGDFAQALKVLEFMNDGGYEIENKYYTLLMSGYNKHRQYDNTLVVFNLFNGEKRVADAHMYHELLVALVRLDIINKGNFEKPTAVVDNIMQAYKLKKLSITGPLHFNTVKPLVKALVKFYRPAEANRLLQNFKLLRPEFDSSYNLNFMKQELMLYSHERDWKGFENVWYNFQHRIKMALSDTGKSPLHLKKVYNAVIKSVYTYHLHTRNVKTFNKLFNELIFVHEFTFDSKSINWVTRRFIMNESTLHYGLQLIEKRLIGGTIASRILRAENRKREQRGLPKLIASSKGQVRRPYLRIGHLYAKDLVNALYMHIMRLRHVARDRELKPGKLENWVDPYEHLTHKYPHLMKNLPELRYRVRRARQKV